MCVIEYILDDLVMISESNLHVTFVRNTKVKLCRGVS